MRNAAAGSGHTLTSPEYRGPIDPRDMTDPLLAALIGKIPRGGTHWTAEQRTAWLQMMWMAFDVVFGPTGTDGAIDLPAFLRPREKAAAATLTVAPATPAAAPVARAKHAGHNFYIDLEGAACNAEGIPVLVSDIPADEIVFDYRPPAGDFRDHAGITWADGTQGTAGLAPGVSYCGPG